VSTIFLEISKYSTGFYKILKSTAGFTILFGFFDLLRQYSVYFMSPLSEKVLLCFLRIHLHCLTAPAAKPEAKLFCKDINSIKVGRGERQTPPLSSPNPQGLLQRMRSARVDYHNKYINLRNCIIRSSGPTFQKRIAGGVQ
jgi:hypothetical protein